MELKYDNGYIQCYCCGTFNRTAYGIEIAIAQTNHNINKTF